MYIKSIDKLDDTTLDIQLLEKPISSKGIIGSEIVSLYKDFLSINTNRGPTIVGKILKQKPQQQRYIIDASPVIINSFLGSIPSEDSYNFTITYDNIINFPEDFTISSKEKKDLLKNCIDLVYDFENYKRTILIELYGELQIVELYKTLNCISVSLNSLSNILRANRTLKAFTTDDKDGFKAIDLLKNINSKQDNTSLICKLRKCLEIDRVIIYRFHKERKIGKIVEECKSNRADSLLGLWVEDPCFNIDLLEQYRKDERASIIENINVGERAPCFIELVRDKLKTVAEFVIPISVLGEMWGLIACHHTEPYQWSDKDRLLIYQCRDNIVNQLKYHIVEARIDNLESNFENILDQRNQTLKHTNKLLQTVIDNLPMEIGLKSTDGKFLLVNNKLSEYAGFDTPQDMVGKTDFDCSWTLEETKHYRKDDLRVINNKTPLLNIIEKQTTAEGNVIWLSTSKIPIFDDKNKVQSILVSVLDITQMKDMKAQLSQSESILDTVVSESQSILYTIDTEGHIKIAQGKGWSLIGIDPIDVIGNNIFTNGFLDNISRDNIKQVLKGDKREWVSSIKDRNLRNTSRVIKLPSGEVIGAVVFGFDITDIVNKTKELQQFAYVASHDLQEPLRMITNFLELLIHWYGPDTNKPLDNKAYGYIDKAIKGSKRMKILIDDLLEYSRVETRAKDKEWFNPEDIVKEVLDNLYLQIQEKKANIEVNSNIRAIKADRSQLQQVIQNLVNNSLKFNENNPKITISIDENSTHWVFVIEDNGIGLNTKYRDKILEPFKRLHTNEEYIGTGMGLAICKRIVDRHKGNIDIESKVGHGSKFIFSLLKE